MTKRANHEGTFTKRKDGKWMGRIQIDGKRYCFYGSTRNEVSKKVEEAKSRHNSGAEIQPNNYTVEEWASFWLNNYIKLQVRENTFLKHVTNVNKHILPTLGEIPLQKLSIIHIQQLIKQKLEAGLSPSTVKIIRNTINAIMRYAVEVGIIVKNPVSSISVKNAPRKEIDTLSAEQIKYLLSEATGHKLYPALLILVTTGLRRSELCGLKWEDINWEQKAICIQRSIVKLGGYDIRIHDTKTGTSRRLIPLHETVVEVLKQYQQEQYPKREFIFSRPDGQPLYPEVIYDFLKSLGKRLGMPYINVHMLRHTCATLLLQVGENPKIVQELLGHSSIKVTLDIYSHVIPSMKKSAVDKLANIIGNGV